MKNRSLGFVLVLLSSVLVLSGCAGSRSIGSPIGASAMVVNDVTYPTDYRSSTQFQLRKADFKVVGPIKVSVVSTSMLGIISSGDVGYGTLMEEARKKYGKVDALIDIMVDTHYYKILSLYVRTETILSANAITYN